MMLQGTPLTSAIYIGKHSLERQAVGDVQSRVAGIVFCISGYKDIHSLSLQRVT